MPEATLNAVTDHGQIPGDSIDGTYDSHRHARPEILVTTGTGIPPALVKD